MKRELQNVCEMFIENKEIIHKAFPWQNMRIALAGASMFTSLAELADIHRLQYCEEILKESAGVFSELRGYAKIPLICRMSQSMEPDLYLERVDAVKEMLKTGIDQTYTVIAAMNIVDHVDPCDYEMIAERTLYIYDRMNDEHPVLTSRSDLPYAAVMAICDSDVDAVMKDAEICYDLLEPVFTAKDPRQSLSNVLALTPLPCDEKCSKIREIYLLMKASGHKMAKGKTSAILGCFASLNQSAVEIADEIIDADEFLHDQKGFGNIVLGYDVRRMFAAILVMSAFRSADEAFMSSAISTVVAIEIAVAQAAAAAAA